MSATHAALLMIAGGINPPWSEVVNLTRFYNGSMTNVATKGNNFSGGGFNSTHIKWGTNAILNTGTNNQGWQTASHADYTIGTNNFVIEWWQYLSTLTLQNNSLKIYIDDRIIAGTTPVPILYASVADGRLQYSVNGGSDIITTAANAVAISVYQHIAICRASGTTRVFVNGVSVGSVADSNNYVQRPLRRTMAFNGAGGTGLWCSEYRHAIGPGSGIYTANFPVPTNPFPNY